MCASGADNLIISAEGLALTISPERSKPSSSVVDIAARTPIYSSEKSLLVDAELNANTKIVSTELVHFIEDMEDAD